MRRQTHKRKTLLKNFTDRVKAVLPEHIKPEHVDIWFQDESRIGQQGSLTRVWHEKGKRPRIIRQQQFEYAYIFGAVCLRTGTTAALVMPSVNKEAMLLHLRQISKETPKAGMLWW
ncbi:transposase [Paralysiella testudinis]|uniref:Transposase n=1 Tax=Paralysiella testudinis TaxID=2809020 RepID=A0A892ZNU4_9NEIS|nr:transposase [Paralysiella testudinis]QRQ83333.1 transposase [Paralysiella testudinis]